MKLISLLGIKTGSVISVVGAGGKTSFIFSLANELRCRYKVLVTTTTKIYAPEKSQYDYIALDDEKHLINNYCISKEKGIYVFGSLIEKENKLSVLKNINLVDICKYFDYVLIEADGSKKKPIKGWRETEPVILENTNVTVGVLNIQVLGKEINDCLVHRLDRFLELTDAHEKQPVELKHLETIVFSHKGLFKNSLGEKILFINKVETPEDNKGAKQLALNITKNNSGRINKIIAGSLKHSTFSLEL